MNISDGSRRAWLAPTSILALGAAVFAVSREKSRAGSFPEGLMNWSDSDRPLVTGHDFTDWRRKGWNGQEGG